MSVIEIAHVALAAGVTQDQFVEQNRILEAGYITQQPGFLSRELASGAEHGQYIVVIHWHTIEDAEASMSHFATDPSAQGFMAMIDPTAMTMNRYTTIAVG